MRCWQCKCGKIQSFGSDSPAPCRECPECHTNPMGQAVIEHDFTTRKVTTDEGEKGLTYCRMCLETKQQIDARNTPQLD